MVDSIFVAVMLFIMLVCIGIIITLLRDVIAMFKYDNGDSTRGIPVRKSRNAEKEVERIIEERNKAWDEMENPSQRPSNKEKN